VQMDPVTATATSSACYITDMCCYIALHHRGSPALRNG
jgi:hypothetical protein